MGFDAGLGLLSATAFGTIMEAEGYERKEDSDAWAERFLFAGRLISLLPYVGMPTIAAATRAHWLGLGLLILGSAASNVYRFVNKDVDTDPEDRLVADRLDKISSGFSALTKVVNIYAAALALSQAAPIATSALAFGVVPLALLATAVAVKGIAAQLSTFSEVV